MVVAEVMPYYASFYNVASLRTDFVLIYPKMQLPGIGACCLSSLHKITVANWGTRAVSGTYKHTPPHAHS